MALGQASGTPATGATLDDSVRQVSRMFTALPSARQL
jgi:hypothetical protein